MSSAKRPSAPCRIDLLNSLCIYLLHVSLFSLCSIIGISLDMYFFSREAADIDGQIPMPRLSHLIDLPICTKN